MSMTMEPGPSRAFRTNLTIAAAEAIEARGERVDRDSLSAEMGMRPKATYNAVLRAKLDPRWRWKMPRRAMPVIAPEARAERNRRIVEARREVHPYRATAEEEAEIAAAKAEVLAEIRAGMIDGTMEQDETPHGVPPRSNKDHAAWNRMTFTKEYAGVYEPRRSRDFRPMGGHR
jgi:hypothetical protein